MGRAAITSLNPVIPVEDMVQSIGFYKKLGFKDVFDSTHYSSGPIDYAVLCRGRICIHLQRFDSIATFTAPQLRLEVSDVAALLEEHQQAGGLSDIKIRKTAWGTLEFGLYAPEKTALIFYESIADDRK